MLLYSRHRGFYRFGCIFLIVFFLPVSVGYWNFVEAAAYAAAKEEQAQAREDNSPLSLLPDETMGLLKGGPATDATAPPQAKLPDGKIVLAQLLQNGTGGGCCFPVGGCANVA